MSYEKEIVFSKKVECTEETLVAILSGWSSIGYGVNSLDYDKNDYAAAKASLINDGHEEQNICREDVWARLLFRGGMLAIHFDDGEEDDIKSISVDDIINGVNKYVDRYNIAAEDFENDVLCDNEACDSVIQLAAFGEVIYG